MRYTTNQRQTFAVLVLASTLVAFWLTRAKLDPFWIVLYAAAFPAGFRAIMITSANVEPTNPWLLVRVWLALRRGEIVLHYQPKITLATGEVNRVEALARWDHPRRGLLPPSEWLHATESRWLEMRFCRYVLDATVRQAALWRRDMRDLLVQVNVSPRCFVDRRLVRNVADQLEHWEVPPSFIALEITEAALELPDRALIAADQLTTMGVKLALDDFGIGHSSMERLARLPFAEIKIDKRFVLGMLGSRRHQAIVDAVVSLGHGLGMAVVAEGVEDTATRDRLLANGCDLAQGFLYSKALPPAEVAAWIDERPDERRAPSVAEGAGGEVPLPPDS